MGKKVKAKVVSRRVGVCRGCGRVAVFRSATWCRSGRRVRCLSCGGVMDAKVGQPQPPVVVVVQSPTARRPPVRSIVRGRPLTPAVATHDADAAERWKQLLAGRAAQADEDTPANGGA